MLFPKKSRSSQALALEPRMMFDAEGADQAVSVLASEATDASSQAVEATGDAAVIDVESTNIDYVGRPDDYDSATYGNVLASAEDITVSSDGKYVYAVSSNSSSWSSASAVLSVFSVDESGSLTLESTYYNYTNQYNSETGTNDQIIQNEGLAGASIVRLSEDQNYLYVFGEGDNSLVVFSRDADSGGLTFVGNTDVSAFGVNGVSDFVYDIEESNGYLYIAGSDSVIVLSIGDDGTLNQIASYTNGVEGLTGANSIAISEDGNTLVVGSSGEDSVVSLFSVNDDGSLDYVSSVAGDDDAYYIQSVAVSSDGQTVYALNENEGSTLLVMTYDDNGVLVITGTYDTSEEARTILISEDGTGVFVMGKNIDIFFQNDESVLSPVSTVNGTSNDLGAYFTGITNAYLSTDKTKLFTVVNNSILTFELDVPSVSYTENATATPILPTGIISDSELDALDDYQGASYTVVREGGGLEEDSFSFQNGNGLTLENDMILLNGEAIASFAVENNALKVMFTASATRETAQAVLRQVAYANTSNDPIANGASPTFVITVDDGDGNQTSLNVTVDLIGVNNPAVISTTPAESTYHAGDDYISLFSGTSIDTIEEGQSVWQVILTIEGASSDDVLKVGSGKFHLTAFSGTQMTSEGMSYSVSESNGTTTVILYLMKSAEEASAVVDSVTYKYDGADLSGERVVTLDLVEYTSASDIGEAKAHYDGAAIITFAMAEQENEPPEVVGNTAIEYTENGEAFSIFPDTTLSDLQMDAYNGGLGNYHGAVLTVALNDASSSDVLSFQDGNDLVLSNGVELQKDGVIIGTVLLIDDVLTITFTEDNGVIPTTQDVQNVLNQIQYKNSSDSPVDVINVSVELMDQNGLISETLTTQINITSVNDVPVVAIDPILAAGEIDLIDSVDAILGLENITASTVSSDGSIYYVADSVGNIAVFSHDSGEWQYQTTLASTDSLNSIDKLVTTYDGQSLYVIGNGGGLIDVFKLGDNNELTEVQTIVSDSSNSYTIGILDFVLSEDGENAYYVNGTYLNAMSRNTETGELTFTESIGDAWSEPYLWQAESLTVSGNYVFVVANVASSTLIAFERTESGLSWTAYLRNGGSDSSGQPVVLNSPNHVVATENGEYVYIVSGSSIYTYAYDITDKSLSVVNTQDALVVDNLTDIAVSSSGSELFVSTSEGTLNRYLIGEDGDLTLLDAVQNAVSGGQEISTSSDGQVLLQGDGLAIFDASGLSTPRYEIGFEAVALAPTTAIYDAEFAALDNYKGLTLSIQSTSPSADDVFDILSDSGFSIQGENLFFNDALVGTFTVENGVLTVAITGDLTQSQVNTLIQNVSYENPSITEEITQTFIVSANDGEINGIELQTELNLVRNSIPEAIGGYVMPSIMETAPNSIVLPESLFVDAGGEALTWTVSGLPNGLTFDPLTRTISGRASESGTFSLTFTATDPRLQSASLELDLVVERLPLADLTSNENDSSIPSSSNRASSLDIGIGGTLAQGSTGNLLSAALPTDTSFGLFEANDQRMPVFSSENDGTSQSLESQSPLPIEAYRFAALTWQGGDRQVAFSLLDNVLSAEEKTILAVTLADGVSLPDGVEFDADTGELTINNAVFEATDQIELQILVVDKQGNASIVPVEVTLQAAQQTSAVPFALQVKNAGLMSLSDNSQMLLAELSVN